MKNNTVVRAIAILGVLTFTGLAHADLDDGLVAFYSFENNADDVSENENHGTESGDIEYTSGVKGKAVVFDGKDDFIYIKHNEELNITEDYSIAFWVNSDSKFNVQNVLTKGRDCLNSYFFRSSGRQFGISYGDSPCNDTVPVTVSASTTELQSNKWYFVTGVVSNSDEKLSYYLDGRLISETEIPFYQTTNTYPLILGRHAVNPDGSGGLEFPFSGKLDEVRLYDRSLSKSEIQELYNKDAPVIEEIQLPVAFLSDNLEIYMPAIYYPPSGDHFAATLVLDESQNNKIIWKLAQLDKSDCSAVTCSLPPLAASVSPELDIDIPLTSHFGSNRYSATLEFLGDSDGTFSWKLGQATIVNDNTGRR